MSEIKKILTAQRLKAGYYMGRGLRDMKVVIDTFDLEIECGQLVALIGLNGSGKSTLLRTFAGLIPPLGGKILINNNNLLTLSDSQKAKNIGIVLTGSLPPMNMTASEFIELGRNPYTNWIGKLTRNDRAIIETAIFDTSVAHLLDRQIHELSDGERQRVMIARALAQDTTLLLMDEPTSHLDFINKIEILKLLKNICRLKGKTILMATHEITLSMTLANQILLIDNNKQIHKGIPEDLILEGWFDKICHHPGIKFNPMGYRFEFDSMYKPKKTIHFTGKNHFYELTKAALEREGFTDEHLATNPIAKVNIIDKNDGEIIWELTVRNQKIEATSIGDLIVSLRKILV